MDESELIVEISENVLSDKFEERIKLFFREHGFEANSSCVHKGNKIICFESVDDPDADKCKITKPESEENNED